VNQLDDLALGQRPERHHAAPIAAQSARQPFRGKVPLFAQAPGEDVQRGAACAALRRASQHPAAAAVDPLNIIHDDDARSHLEQQLAQELRETFGEQVLGVIRSRQGRKVLEDPGQRR
jgi:hypothetical protein